VLRVLSYNIRFGGTGRDAAIAEVIRAANADIVMLQEATDPLVVARIAQQAAMPYWDARPGFSTGYVSREPVQEHAWHHPRGARHAFLEVVLPGDAGRLYSLHLHPWFSKWSEQRRAREIRMLLESIREHQHGFHLLAGDFNALAPGAILDTRNMPVWIQAMVWISGRDIARETIETMLRARYVDAWRATHDGDPGFTFPTWKPHVRLDYVFTPERYAARIRRCDVLYDAPDVKTASDHFPLLVEVELDRPAL
jgi:exodeoxyribonuclease-3